MADPDNEKQPRTGHFDKNQALRSHSFCFTALSYKNTLINSIFSIIFVGKVS